MESNFTLTMTRASDSFSTVLLIVNEGHWVCIVHDLETIIVSRFIVKHVIVSVMLG